MGGMYWSVDFRDLEELEELAAIEAHYAPVHPGAGTPQVVHAGRGALMALVLPFVEAGKAVVDEIERRGREPRESIRFWTQVFNKLKEREDPTARPGEVRVTVWGARAPRDKPYHRDFVDSVLRLLSKRVDGDLLRTPESLDVQVSKRVDRAYAEPGRIYLEPYPKTATVAHEIGHVVELADGNLLKDAQRLLAVRTWGEKPKSLRVLTRNIGYDDDEVARPDKFPSPYIGKVYTDATEVVSSAFAMLADPVIFKKWSERDPEFTYWVIGRLTRRGRRMRERLRRRKERR